MAKVQAEWDSVGGKDDCGALPRGSELIKDEEMAKVQAEWDSQLAAKMINEGSSTTALSSSLTSECRAMLDEIGCYLTRMLRESTKAPPQLPCLAALLANDEPCWMKSEALLTHTLREGNKVADKLAKLSVDQEEGKKVADKLAKLSVDQEDHLVSLVTPPKEIKDLLVADIENIT